MRNIPYVFTGGHFVVVLLVNNKKYTFNSTVNVEIVSKMCGMFEIINKFLSTLSTKVLSAKFPKENAYRII